jgi:hypothetical protein
MATEADRMREVWAAFQYASAGDELMPATLFGESVRSTSKANNHKANSDSHP